jgi:hypothetical protein
MLVICAGRTPRKRRSFFFKKEDIKMTVRPLLTTLFRTVAMLRIEPRYGNDDGELKMVPSASKTQTPCSTRDFAGVFHE